MRCLPVESYSNSSPAQATTLCKVETSRQMTCLELLVGCLAQARQRATAAEAQWERAAAQATEALSAGDLAVPLWAALADAALLRRFFAASLRQESPDLAKYGAT